MTRRLLPAAAASVAIVFEIVDAAHAKALLGLKGDPCCAELARLLMQLLLLLLEATAGSKEPVEGLHNS